jgi:BASS family bile acid:Na+ symporter
MGMVLNTTSPKLSKRIGTYTPALSVLLISLICGSVVSVNAATILSSGLPLLASVLLLHTLGFIFGYTIPRLFYSKRTARTISIETGMQNSALAVVLANSLGNSQAAIPGAISATVHSCLGSILAALWKYNDEKEKRVRETETKNTSNI